MLERLFHVYARNVTVVLRFFLRAIRRKGISIRVTKTLADLLRIFCELNCVSGLLI